MHMYVYVYAYAYVYVNAYVYVCVCTCLFMYMWISLGFSGPPVSNWFGPWVSMHAAVAVRAVRAVRVADKPALRAVVCVSDSSADSRG